MKTILFILLSLFIAAPALADIDTFEGTATEDLVSIEGQAVAGGGTDCSGCSADGSNDSAQVDLITKDGQVILRDPCSTGSPDGNFTALAQKITLAADTCVTGYSSYVKKSGSPVATYNMQLYTDSSGPSSPVAGTLATMAAADLPTNLGSQVEMLIGTTATVDDGDYWIVEWVSSVTTLDGTNNILPQVNSAGTNLYEQTTSSSCPPESSNWQAMADLYSRSIQLLGCTP